MNEPKMFILPEADYTVTIKSQKRSTSAHGQPYFDCEVVEEHQPRLFLGRVSYSRLFISKFGDPTKSEVTQDPEDGSWLVGMRVNIRIKHHTAAAFGSAVLISSTPMGYPIDDPQIVPRPAGVPDEESGSF